MSSASFRNKLDGVQRTRQTLTVLFQICLADETVSPASTYQIQRMANAARAIVNILRNQPKNGNDAMEVYECAMGEMRARQKQLPLILLATRQYSDAGLIPKPFLELLGAVMDLVTQLMHCFISDPNGKFMQAQLFFYSLLFVLQDGVNYTSMTYFFEQSAVPVCHVAWLMWVLVYNHTRIQLKLLADSGLKEFLLNHMDIRSSKKSTRTPDYTERLQEGIQVAGLFWSFSGRGGNGNFKNDETKTAQYKWLKFVLDREQEQRSTYKPLTFLVQLISQKENINAAYVGMGAVFALFSFECELVEPLVKHLVISLGITRHVCRVLHEAVTPDIKVKALELLGMLCYHYPSAIGTESAAIEKTLVLLGSCMFVGDNALPSLRTNGRDVERSAVLAVGCSVYGNPDAQMILTKLENGLYFNRMCELSFAFMRSHYATPGNATHAFSSVHRLTAAAILGLSMVIRSNQSDTQSYIASHVFPDARAKQRGNEAVNEPSPSNNVLATMFHLLSQRRSGFYAPAQISTIFLESISDVIGRNPAVVSRVLALDGISKLLSVVGKMSLAYRNACVLRRCVEVCPKHAQFQRKAGQIAYHKGSEMTGVTLVLQHSLHVSAPRPIEIKTGSVINEQAYHQWASARATSLSTGVPLVPLRWGCDCLALRDNTVYCELPFAVYHELMEKYPMPSSLAPPDRKNSTQPLSLFGDFADMGTNAKKNILDVLRRALLRTGGNDLGLISDAVLGDCINVNVEARLRDITIYNECLSAAAICLSRVCQTLDGMRDIDDPVLSGEDCVNTLDAVRMIPGDIGVVLLSSLKWICRGNPTLYNTREVYDLMKSRLEFLPASPPAEAKAHGNSAPKTEEDKEEDQEEADEEGEQEEEEEEDGSKKRGQKRKAPPRGSQKETPSRASKRSKRSR